MTLSISQNYTAVAVNIQASFLGMGGTGPYTYAVLPGGPGGTIDASTGVYVAPAAASSNDPTQLYDPIQVTDSLSATATAQILVGTPLLLFCEIIQREMNLTQGRVYLWDQKIFQPSDFDLYIAVSVPSCKSFANTNRSSADGTMQEQFVSMMATLDIDILSRGPSARDRKEEVLLALNSTYAEQQMEANSFLIGKLSTRFLNLSNVDGAAIPYRYRISCNMQYAYSKSQPQSYFSDFSTVSTVVNP